MILEIEIAALLALEAKRYIDARKERKSFAWLNAPETPVTPAPEAAAPAAEPAVEYVSGPKPPAQQVEIIKRENGRWVHVGYRHHEHADVTEALRTPGLALRRHDGAINEGVR
jgi:hypothetical protein